MPKVNFVLHTGEQHLVDAATGQSVMASAVRNGVPGIVAECGGNASCGTCHVWVREEFLPRLADIEEVEEDLLDMGVSDRRAGSRLSCQLPVTPELDGLTVDVPAEQP